MWIILSGRTKKKKWSNASLDYTAALILKFVEAFWTIGRLKPCKRFKLQPQDDDLFASSKNLHLFLQMCPRPNFFLLVSSIPE